MINRKGDERILSLYWFLMFIIIAIAVSSGIISFYGHPLDIREKEANILADKVIKCFADKGILDSERLKINNLEGFEKECGIIFKDTTEEAYISDFETDLQYYVNVGLKTESISYSLEAGNKQVRCNIAESKINIPTCSEKRIYVLDSENKFVLMEIETGVKKIEQNAK